ncbi:hypothetical protein DVW01_15005 [Enterococcus faecium]|nr:hypothetical protein B1148_01040 [Enterococcus faecium]RCN92562.1 hypothetical protein B1143_02145 [Enterococcus faecium]RCO02258.1 hypothetical protein B1151_01510 [Enterococcus faecium]RCT81521.1 hypothetical protein B1174_08260 [Enterococcus faecium]TKL13869.1 hypothetical protein DVW00_14095 [Enterococcus faecium]
MGNDIPQGLVSLIFQLLLVIIAVWKRDEFLQEQENTKSQPMSVGWDFFALVVETNVWIRKQLALVIVFLV